MKIEDNLLIEKQDLDYMLTRYLRSYLFYHKNNPPAEIEVPMIPAIKNPWSKDSSMIPVKFVEFKAEIVTPAEVLELPDKVEEIEETKE